MTIFEYYPIQSYVSTVYCNELKKNKKQKKQQQHKTEAKWDSKAMRKD